ncbi:hypothetical protein OIU09_26260 [Escherichia coli]|uniref:hypothetical protein n=1 Tax=Escherichia coli TaxID=562 RepID=UPI00235085B9|nr:hypothetical protein [Escherichia coli]MDC7908244.1 hypothetical protein [Escherichia coli]
MADPASRRRGTSDYGSRYKGPVGTGELGVTEVDIRENSLSNFGEDGLLMTITHPTLRTTVGQYGSLKVII